MSYFSRFPFVAYTVDGGTTYNVVSDVLRRIAVKQETKENYSLYEEYIVQDGETPETVSHKFYNDTQYHWVVMMLNDIIDPRFDWPLSDTQLYDYVNNKYNGNISGIRQYLKSEDSDIVVSNDQEVTEKTHINIQYKFAKDVSLHFQYAANAASTSNMSPSDAALVAYLRSPSDTPLANANIARGDVGRFWYALKDNDLPIDPAFLDNYEKFTDWSVVGNADINGVSITATYEGFWYQPNVQTANPIEGPIAAIDFWSLGPRGNYLSFITWNQPGLNQNRGTWGEETKYHIINHLIKPIVDSGNTILLSYLDIRSDRGLNPYTSHYYANGNYYFVGNTFLQVMDNVRLNVGNVASGHQLLYDYLLEPIDQQYYLKGDFNYSSTLGGNVQSLTASNFAGNTWPIASPYNEGPVNVYHGWGNTDVALAISSYNNTLTSSNPHYPNVQIVLSEMYNDATLREFVEIKSVQTSSNLEIAYPDAYPVTNLEYESKLNEQKRTIKVLRPKYLTSFLAEFEALVNG